MTVTYNIVPANATNGSWTNATPVHPVCSDMFPTTDVYFEDLRHNYGEAVLIGICCLLTLILLILYCAQLRSRYYKYQDKVKRFKTLTLLGLYPMTSLMSTFALLVPRSTILVDLVASCYLSICIYVFITIIFHYFGGKDPMIEAMDPYKVTIRTPPCCCCCCCLPDLKVNRSNIRRFEILTMQIAVVVPLVLFIKAVLWTDDVNVLEGVNPKNSLFYIILATVISTLFAMYGLVVMVKASEKILKKHRIRMKFIVLQLVLIFTNLQSAIISIFYRFNLPPCRGVIGTKVRGSVIQHMMLVLEMFLLALWASQAYKKSEHRNLAETYITDASDATLIPRKYGTVATSTDDLHKYSIDATEDLLPTNGTITVQTSVPRFTLEG